MALIEEVAESKRILSSISAGKALVSHIKKGEVAFDLHSRGDLLPLLRSRVDTRRVVGAGMEEEDGVARSLLDVVDQTVNVEADGLLVVVTVGLDVQPAIMEDGLVVRPRRVWEVDGLSVRVETLEESTTNAKGTGSGNGLGDGHVLEELGVGAIGEAGGGLGESGNTGDPGILFVQTTLQDTLLGGTNRWQDIGLSSIITVCTHTCIVQEFMSAPRTATRWNPSFRAELNTHQD